jgi:osmotically-inducible protein OsmY
VVTESPPDLPPTTTTVASSASLALAENIRALLAADPTLNSAARDVRISVYNGRLTLTGRTVTELERQRLHSALAGLPGVSRVDDRVQVDLQR